MSLLHAVSLPCRHQQTLWYGRVASYTQQLHSISVNHSPNPNSDPNPTPTNPNPNCNPTPT